MELMMDVAQPWRVNDRYWTFCIGGGHAALALRYDYQALVKQVCQELGFQRLRFHGIFNDDMQVVTTFDKLLKVPGAKGVETISFYQIAVVYDALLAAGIKPFVELGFMPNALAKKRKHVFYYKANVSKPKDDEAWCQLIKSFITFLIKRYGEQEVETWYFEVWNEPDLKGFFYTGSKEDYFHFYKITALSVKAILPNAIVGGPATSQNRWLKAFREYCVREQVPLSFLSTHHYPGDDIGLPIVTIENVRRLLCTAKQHQKESVHDVFRHMMVREKILPLMRKDAMYQQIEQAHQEAASLPLYYTEWNVNPTCTHPIHDTCASAAFIIKHVMDGQFQMQGCSFFTFSDIFEENTFFTEPFSGSFGLTTIHGIPKPSYWAFYFLNQLKGHRLQLPITHDHVEYAIFGGGHELQILIYAQEYVQDDRHEDLMLQLPKTLTPIAAYYESINEMDTNPKNVWESMGAMTYLREEQIQAIKQASRPQRREIVYQRSMHGWEARMTIKTNEVIFMSIQLKEDMDEHIANAKADNA